jgi:hypothetical protein
MRLIRPARAAVERMSEMNPRTAWWRLSGLCVLVGCGSSGLIRPAPPKDPTALGKCHVAASQTSPLVTEWPASEKAHLEGMIREGAVVVAYNGCDMHLLTECRPKGTYSWQRTTLATDTIEIRNEDELYAKLPLGAASLEGELKTSGRLAVRTTVAGQMKLTGVATTDIPTDGGCAGATHVISGLSVGAFKLLAGGAASAKGSASYMGAGGGGSSKSEEVLVREAGDPKACADTTDEKPNGACQSPIQIFLWPLPKKAEDKVVDANSPEAPPPPGAIRANFIQPAADQHWRLMKGSAVVCELPCTRWVPPNHGYSLQLDTDKKEDARTLPLANDLGYTPGRTIDVVPTAGRGSVVAGWSMIFVGGVFGGVGVALLVDACPYANDNPESKAVGACAAGKAFTPIGLVVAGLGVWLTVYSRRERIDTTLVSEGSAHASIRWLPGAIAASSGGKNPVTAILGPGGLAGSF